MTTADSLNNTHGDINSRGNLSTTSNQLNNHQGKMQALGDIQINTRGYEINNTDSGSDGGLLATGSITLNTGRVNNDAGYIGASDDINIHSSDTVSNQYSGTLLSLRNMTINGISLDNRDSQIQAAGDIDVNVGSGQVNNEGGLLRSNSALTVNAASISNHNTQTTDQGIEAQHVILNSNTIDNTSGQIIADDLTIRGQGTVTNNKGLLSASKTLDVGDTASHKTQAISNTEGKLVAGQQLKLNSFNLIGQGKVLSQGTMNVNLSGDYTHVNDVIANDDLIFALSGHLNNQALLMASGDLNIIAASLYNAANAELSGTNTNLTISGDFTNDGLIDGGNTSIDTHRLFNESTGRIYGDHISIEADELYNRQASGKSAVIAARQELDLGVGTLDNRDHSLILSLGDMSIRGAISGGQATGTASHITNASATIEAEGGLEIHADRLDNLNLDFQIGEQTSSQQVTAYSINGYGSTHYDESATAYRYQDEVSFARTPSGSSSSFFQYDFTRTTSQPVVIKSDPGKILSGQSTLLTVDMVNNSNSQIIAGGDLSHSGVINNSSSTGTRKVSESGTYTEFWRQSARGHDRQKSRGGSYSGPTNLQRELKLLAVKENYHFGRGDEDPFAGIDYTVVEVHTEQRRDRDGYYEVSIIGYAYAPGDMNGSAQTSTVSLQTSVYRANTRTTQGFDINELSIDKVTQNVSSTNSAELSHRTVKPNNNSGAFKPSNNGVTFKLDNNNGVFKPSNNGVAFKLEIIVEPLNLVTTVESLAHYLQQSVLLRHRNVIRATLPSSPRRMGVIVLSMIHPRLRSLKW
ncbi:hypothetical protein AB835_13440 [Candidatus Endobugula sertula]|uniref:Uncharacterized protein n=1 Tax=Candidatus Endobugula sertula TaxID=62101 RepID=A0A1D2QLW5_9GAMM|nr:hypothetical protein AB835_13440 [Candidatus Endobugula sertula]